MADISDEALQEEIAVFFTPRVHAYLEKCIKRAQFVGKLFSPSHALNILRAFEAEIVHLPSSEIPQNDYQGTLDLWKKTFTRNILVPKYLLQDPHIDIEHVIQLMQKVLYTACQEVKTETYVLSLKKTIINSVRNVPVLERLKRARQILHSSIKVLGKMEKAFPTEPVLIAFSPAKLEALIRESTAPLPPTQEPLPSETVETYPIKKKVRLSQPLNDFLDRDNLKAFLHNHLILHIQEPILKASSLLAKLQVVSTLLPLLETKKELLPLWIEGWQNKPAVKRAFLIEESLKILPSIVNQIRGEVLAHCCIEEMYAARSQSTPQAYTKIRTAILERYLRFYLQENDLRECFLKALHEEERTERERFLPPMSESGPAVSKSPSKTSIWQKV